MNRSLHLLLFLFLAIALCPTAILAQSVAINADSSLADPSAIFDIKSSKKGVLVPRMTQTQRDLIAVPAVGLLIYQTDNTPGFYYFDGLVWSAVKGSNGAGGGGSGGADSFWTAKGNDIYNTNSGKIGIGTSTPVGKLTVQTGSNDYGFTQVSDNGVTLSTNASEQQAGIGTFSNNAMNIYVNSQSAMLFQANNGHAVIGFNGPVTDAQLTVYTPPPNGLYGLCHTNGDVYLDTYVGGGTYGGWFGTHSNHDLFFFTNNSPPRMALTKDGYVGVRVDHPANYFQVGSFAAGVPAFSNSDFVIADGGSASIDAFADRTEFVSSADFNFFPRLGNGGGGLGIATTVPVRNKLQIGNLGSAGFNGNDIAFGNGTQAAALVQLPQALEIASNVNIALMPQVGSFQGRVGINVLDPAASLHVGGYVTQPNSYNYHYYDNGGDGYDNYTPDLSILAEREIQALAFIVPSDARLKNIIGVSNAAKDLKAIEALRITDYTMKERTKYSNRRFKKVIAQQVEKIYPEAISKGPGFIPNVYLPVDTINQSPAGLRLRFRTPHQLTADAKKLRILPENQHAWLEYPIVAIPSPNEVVIADTSKASRMFVYGQEVPDLRRVDYDALTTLNISATQQLSKEFKQMQVELAEARAAIRSLTRELHQSRRPAVTNRLASTTLKPHPSDHKQAKKI